MKYSRCLMGFAVIFALSTTGKCIEILTDDYDDNDDNDSQTMPHFSAAAQSQIIPFVSSICEFSLDFLKKLHETESTAGTLKKNFVFSPSSIFRALLLLSFGAKGDTESQLKRALHLETIDRVKEDFKTWKGPNVPNVLEADLLYYDFSVQMKEEIKTLLTSNIQEVTMSDPSTLEKVNKWVSEMTGGNIQELLTSPLEDVKLMILSVVYMKAKWEVKFDEKLTKKVDFQTADGTPEKVDMMHLKAKLKYVDSKSLNSQVVSLNYGESSLSFLVFLPKVNESQTVDGLISLLSRDEVNRTVDSMVSADVDLYLPKFMVQEDIDLIPTLKKLIIIDVFTDASDLSGFTDQNKLYVKKALHKTVLEVDEEGTTAAAATTVKTTFLSYSISVEFKADHPFVYMIYDRDSHIPLFLGVMMDPTQ